MVFEDAKSKLPVFIGRSEIEKYFPGVIARGTLANLNSQGRGPRYIKRGRKVFYYRDDILEWLKRESKNISTADQK